MNTTPPLAEKVPPIPPVIAPHRFREVLDAPELAREFFYPLNVASWEDDRFHLGKNTPEQAGASISGVRLHAREGASQEIIRDCQTDMKNLVQSVVQLRKAPELSGAVLSAEPFVRAPFLGSSAGERVKFGLYCPRDGRFHDEVSAADECHKQIVRSVRQAGFLVAKPKEFLPPSGFRGLMEWAGNLELSKRRRYTPPKWLLLFLLLPLLFLLPWKCNNSNTAIPPEAQFVFDVPVKTESFILLVDKSKSMESSLPQVRAEVKRFLNDRLKNGAVKSHGDVIYFDSKATSAIGEMKELSPKVNDDICKCLDALKAGGGTNLESAIKLAAEELRKQGKKDATIVILTDGEDPSIHRMLKDINGVKNLFGSTKIIVNTTTPRLLSNPSNMTPSNEFEKQLQKLSRELGGDFGPQ